MKANAVRRRNLRGGRGTAENFIAALRCLYRHAEDDGLIKPNENPARRAAKPRRQGSVRHTLSATQMSEINFYASATGATPNSTHCCSGCTPNPPAAPAAPWPFGRATSTRTNT